MLFLSGIFALFAEPVQLGKIDEYTVVIPLKATKQERYSAKLLAEYLTKLYKVTVPVKADNIKQIMIYNSLGQMMKSVDCNDNINDINVSDLENGIYFLNVIDNEGKISTNKISVLH